MMEKNMQRMMKLVCLGIILLCVTSGMTKGEGDAELAGEGNKFEKHQGGEKFEFQAEVKRLLDILVNSLYTNKDIFLRELISNASDALDKLRFLAIGDPSQMNSSTSPLEVEVSVDHENGILKIRDSGVGMTRDDMINNLGVIANSGTSSFLDKFSKQGDLSLIGQFGVGFYSVYLVSEYVEVVSKNNDDVQHIWASSADGSFVIDVDTEGEPMERGTEIRIYLQPDAIDIYADEEKLESIIKKHSQFINYPIKLLVPETEVIESDHHGNEEEEEDEEEEAFETVVTYKWWVLNAAKPVWSRSPSEVEEEEYEELYAVLAEASGGEAAITSLDKVHFSAEGDIEFKALAFIPERPASDFYSNIVTKDDFDIVPDYLSFMIGVVDSDSLPLSVSRETLSEEASLKIISKKVTRKVLDLLRKMAEGGDCLMEEEEEKENDEEAPSCSYTKYQHFWDNFGLSLKYGILEDIPNRARLLKLLRYVTSKSDGEYISLEKYVENMQEEQKVIYYCSGSSMKEIEESRSLEKLRARDLEVLFMDENIDEYVMMHVSEFEDVKFQNINSDFDMDESDENAANVQKYYDLHFGPFAQWWKDILRAQKIRVNKVKPSSRMETSPAMVTSGKYGVSANMERIMGAQVNNDRGYTAQRTLHFNPRHPLIRTLKSLYDAETAVETGASIGRAAGLAATVYETSLLDSGWTIEPRDFAERLYSFVSEILDVGNMDELYPEPSQAEIDEMLEEEERKREEVEASYAEREEEEEEDEFLDIDVGDIDLEDFGNFEL